jgi:ATP/maltotriose-dependent transcriptional regulator MalT
VAPNSGHFIGRIEEIEAIDGCLDGLDQGRSTALLLVGEPGIGKTRLLAELGARADERGHLVLTGSASELEQDLPFSVFVDSLDEYLRGLGRDSLESLDRDVRTELAHVFPSLTALASEHEVALQHERYRSHRAVRELLELLARVHPLVVVLDDLHWADSASIELLGALLRRPAATPVLLALAVRPRQMPERLLTALERAARDDTLVRVELGALSADEARELLGDRADAGVLYEESGGNPFYLEQLARVAGTTPAAGETPLAGIEVPSTVAAALTEELGLLSEPARLTLESAAVVGDPFEPELAAAAAQLPAAAVMEAVDELLQFDLLRTTDVPRRFRFRHPLVRRAVYEATAAGWRLGAHERCAEALAGRGASAATRAHHVERSARAGDAAAAAVLREAGEEALRLAPASAAHWFAEALRLLPPSAAAPERVGLLLERAGALTAVGRFADSHSVLLEAAALAPNDPRVARACAAAEFLLGRQEDAGARLAAALERLPDPGSADAVALMIELTANAFWRTAFDQMQSWGLRAVEAARRLDERGLLAGGLASLAIAESVMGSPERAESDHEEATTIIDTLSDDELAAHIGAAAWLAGGELYLDRYAEGDLHAARALAVARATGQGEHVLLLVQILGGIWRQRGKLVEAGELLDGGIESARLLDNTNALVWSLSGRSSTALRQGDVELALATAQESVELSRNAGGSFHSSEASADLAAALLESGQPERAAELLIGAAGGEDLALIAGSPRARYLEVLTRCRLVLGRQDDARRSAATAEAWAAAVQLPMAATWAGRASAAVALDAGDPRGAAERALASAAAADGLGAPVEAALSRLLAGSALAAAGRDDEATAELRRAAATFEAAGALRYRDETEHELRKLGHHVHRRTRPGSTETAGLDALTGRELEIARLVVDRKTNPEIAGELFLSQKTIESHLRNIFRKVGVSSRVELARAVERTDRAE